MKTSTMNPTRWVLLYLLFTIPCSSLLKAQSNNFNCSIEDLILHCSDDINTLIPFWLANNTANIQQSLPNGGTEYTLTNDYSGNYTIIDREISNVLCDSLQIRVADNQLTLSNLSAPNTIAKVFDPNWQIIFNCSGDCPESVHLTDLIAGETYHTDIQFYDEGWNFICEDKRDVLIENSITPCDTSVCQGDVILRTQAEVDAFCGCSVIEGNLSIFPPGPPNQQLITNLKNLASLKEVKGRLTLQNTSLTNLNDLNNLEKIGGVLGFSYSYQLMTLEGMDQLSTIGGLLIANNPILENFSGFPSLTEINGEIFIANNPVLNSFSFFNPFMELDQITITGNPLLKNLVGLSQLQVVKNNLQLRNNNNLIDLKGLENLQKVSGNFIVSNNANLVSLDSLKKLSTVGAVLGISGKNLTSLSGLKNLRKITRLNITDNPVLTNCCDIVHLLDNDTTNGFKPVSILLSGNPEFCNSPEEILINCFSTSSPCHEIQINIIDNQISITNIAAANEIIKIFNQDYQLLYQCISDCEVPQNLEAFNEEDAIIDVQLYDAQWELICSEQFPLQANNSSCNGDICETIPPTLLNIPEDLTVECHEVPPISNAVSANDNCDSEVAITVEEVITEQVCTGSYQLNRIWVATDDCGNTSNARQIIIVQDNTAPILENVPLDLTVSSSEEIPEMTLEIEAKDNCDNDLRITRGIGSGLLGGDTIITKTWSVRDDCGNRASASQIILIKQRSTNCNNIEIARTDSTITFANIDAPNTIFKLFDPNWQFIFECTADCASQLTIPIDKEGIYHTDIQFYDENWQFICELKRDIGEEITIDPCASACQGGVVLANQAEVDAFCGCSQIDGDILIGKNGSDITNINNLIGLRKVTGSLFMNTTKLIDLTGLDSLITIGNTINITSDSLRSLKGLHNLTFVGRGLRIAETNFLKDLNELANLQQLGNLVLEDNDALESLLGLSQIDTLAGITFFGNKSIYQLDELENLNYLSSIYLSGTNITNLNFFKKIRNVQPSIYISANDTLENLAGIEHFDTLGNLVLAANNKLNDASAIKNVQYINKDLIVEFNKELGNCCIIRHLLSGGGRVGGRISLGGNKNGSSCQDVIQLSRCPTAPLSPCENINTIATSAYIGIGSLTAPIEIVKVFDSNYNMVYECFADCEENFQIGDLTAGTYFININLYDENWQHLCEYDRNIEFTGNAQDRNVDFRAQDFILHPNPALEATYIDLHKLTGKETTLTLVNQFGQEVWQKSIPKVGVEKEKIALSTIPNGVYFLQIQTPSRKAIAKKLIVNRLY